MSIDVLQRPFWDGTPIRLGACWTRCRGNRMVTCALYSHQFGWELRLEGTDVFPRSHVCRSQDDVLTVQETWRALLEEYSWTAPAAP